jgi:hypothetical protein
MEQHYDVTISNLFYYIKNNNLLNEKPFCFIIERAGAGVSLYWREQRVFARD